MIPILCALFFASGTAALVFETLWFRQAGLAFGNGVWASSLVLSSFMAGLALGNALAARWGERVRRPLRAYAALEVLVAASGVALVWGLPWLTPRLAPWLRALADWPWAQHGLRLGLGFALLVVPATAMGATLPLLVKALRARDASFGSALGRLYGWNTLGAVLGAVLGELWWIERFGVRGTAFAAAGLNLGAALGALVLRGAPPPLASAAPWPRGPIPAEARRRLAAGFLAGALLLGLEVVWFRFLHLFVHSGPAAFAWMLSAVLAGIGVGGAAGGAWLRRDPDADRHAAAVALAAGTGVAVLYAAFRSTSAPVEGLSPASPAGVLWRSAVLALPVALLSGALFPLLGAAIAREVTPETRAAGLLTLANTLGAASGSLLGGFALLPGLGMERSFFALALGYGALAWLARAGVSAPRRWRRPVAALAAAFALALVWFPFGRMERVYLRIPVERWHAGTDAVVVGVREGRTETAVMVERRLDGEPLNHFLLTDSYSMSSTSTFSKRYMKLFVYWPVAMRPEPKRALLISYGVGSTAKALTDTASLETIDVVDISREILELSDRVFRSPEANPLHDPRVRVHVEDGRHFLQLSEEHYDLITGEPPPPKNAGIVNLYTREYFALIRERLAIGGRATYWLPVHNLLESDARSIVRAFCDVFSDCSLWVGHDLNWMLAGSRGASGAPSLAGFEAQWRVPAVAAELEALGFARPAQLGATFLADAEDLARLAGDAPPLTDDFPKRLSDRLQTDARTAFAPWLEGRAERFRSSAWIAATWPPELREPTLRAFAQQEVVDAVGRRAPVTPSERIEAVHALIDAPGGRMLALWRLGVVAEELRAIDAALAKGRPAAPHQAALGFRALADRDFAAAARHLRRARARRPADATLLYLELYALCRDGRAEEAATLADRLAPRLSHDADSRRFWLWLRDRFGVPAPPWATGVS